MATIYKLQPDCFQEKGYLVVTSPFGKRTDPITGQENVTHAGIDCVLGVANGTKTENRTASITAVEDGEVITAHWGEKDNKNYSSARGNYVKIKHNDKTITLYQHLSNNQQLVKKGDKVKKGQKIGYMGNTGKSGGAHLHFEVQINGKPVDPEPYLIKKILIEVEKEEEMLYNITLTKTLKQNNTGEEVRKTQMRLAQLSPEFEKEMKSHSFSNNQFDGSFGPSMVKTIKKVQALAGLKETGEIDQDTLSFLNTNICDLNKKILDIKKIIN